MARRRGKRHMRALGAKGGRATLLKYGVEHFRELGKAGFLGLARSLGYTGGSRLGALQALIAKGKIRGMTPAEHREADEFHAGFFGPDGPA